MKRSGFVIVKQGKHQVGLQDKDGHEILPCVYDKILDYDDDGYVRFIKDGVYATVDLEGKISIPLSAGLTHLGVFHKGTARARREDDWGLVDERGVPVIDFNFSRIDAYYNQRYFAVKLSGEKGYLSEDGTFTAIEKKKKKEPDYEPKLVAVLEYDTVEENDFWHALQNYCGDGWRSLHLYYRDTDAAFDVKRLYKKDAIIRNDRFLQVSDRLRRPVHRVRFTIASAVALSVSKVWQREQRLKQFVPSWKDFVIPPESYFLVVDVMKYAQTTQVVLLHLPCWAHALAKACDFQFSMVNASMENGTSLREAAALDFQKKMTDVVHGHSLQANWEQAMHHPVGLDDAFKLNDLEKHTYVCQTEEEKYMLNYWQEITYDFQWDYVDILKCQRKNAIRIVCGDIMRFKVDARVESLDLFSCTDVDVNTRLERSILVDVDEKPYKHVVRTPVLQTTLSKKSDIKKVCASYVSALTLAAEQDFGRISIPCMASATKDSLALALAKAVLQTMVAFLRTHKYDGEIFLFCKDESEAQVYAKAVNEESLSLKFG